MFIGLSNLKGFKERDERYFKGSVLLQYLAQIYFPILPFTTTFYV